MELEIDPPPKKGISEKERMTVYKSYIKNHIYSDIFTTFHNPVIHKKEDRTKFRKQYFNLEPGICRTYIIFGTEW